MITAAAATTAGAAFVTAALGAPVVRTVPLMGGVDALMVRAELADGRLVTVRMMPDPTVAERQPLSVDFECLAALADSDLPVPRVLAADLDGSAVGFPVLAMSWLPGQVVGNPADPVACAYQVIRLLERVHAVPALGRVPLPELHGTRVLRAPWPKLPLDSLCRAVWSDMRDRLPPVGRQLVPVHGDAWLGNVLWLEGRLVGLIDWSDAVRSDPALDFASPRLDAVLLGGLGADDTLPAADHQTFWDLWTAAQFLMHAKAWHAGWPECPLSETELVARLRAQLEWLLERDRD